MPDPGVFAIQAGEDDAGKRLDVVIAAKLPDFSRSAAADLIRQQAVTINGRPAKASTTVRLGDRIHGNRPPRPVPSYGPEPIGLDILFEDEALLVINKPPGLVVHPAPGHFTGTLVNALLHHCPELTQSDADGRPGIVHRLDKDTSGTLVVAKTGTALLNLASQFKSRRIDKTYLALVHGVPKAASATIRLPIGRHPVDRQRMSTHSRHGREAVSHWRLCETFAGAALLEVDLETGRTHQIRVHLAASGHAVVGDALYGPGKKAGTGKDILKGASRQMLHAWRLGFAHPLSGDPMAFESPLPADMAGLIDVLRDQGKAAGR